MKASNSSGASAPLTALLRFTRVRYYRVYGTTVSAKKQWLKHNQCDHAIIILNFLYL